MPLDKGKVTIIYFSIIIFFLSKFKKKSARSKQQSNFLEGRAANGKTVKHRL